MQVDCAVLGNHDWDFGYPHLQSLLSKTNFPWLFSNVVDASWRDDDSEQSPELDERDKQIEGTLPYFVMEVKGIKIGCIGLVEEEWLDTVPGFPEEFEYRDMVQTALKLSKELREGPEKCELIFAATHCRLPNDIALANALGAVAKTDPSQHGVDLILGGHDHTYYIGRGVDSYDGTEFERSMMGCENDENTLIVKSGTDFHDLSEVEITLSEPHDDTAVRRRTIERLTVRRHQPCPNDESLPELHELLDQLMQRVTKATEQPVAITLNEWDLRSEKVRTKESGIGDLISDILLMAMERMLRRKSHPKCSKILQNDYRMADCALICGGSLRSDSVFGPGKITLGNLMEIMPFEDPIVVKELTGQDIWDALENGFSTYPKQEGRFPQLAGLQVVWDSSREPGHRVVSVHVLKQPFDGSGPESKETFINIRNSFLYEPDTKSDNENSVMVCRITPEVREELQMHKNYAVVTREYLCQGNDGYDALTRGRYIIDDESGELMSTLVRKFLLGATYISRWNHLHAKCGLDTVDSPMSMSPPSSVGHGDTSHLPKRRRLSMMEQLHKHVDRDQVYLSSGTEDAIQRANKLRLRRSRSVQLPTNASRDTLRKRLHPAAAAILNDSMVVDSTPLAIRDALFVAAHEHHSHFDSASRIDTGLVVDHDCAKEDLAVIVALTDGRMVDQAQSKTNET
ncbi:hydrolase [Malassezia pachydermatis]